MSKQNDIHKISRLLVVDKYLKAGCKTAGIQEDAIIRGNNSIMIIGPGLEIEWNNKANKWRVYEVTWSHENDQKEGLTREVIDEYDEDDLYYLSKEVLLHIVDKQLDVDFNEENTQSQRQ